jgi:hypothetical protein
MLAAGVISRLNQQPPQAHIPLDPTATQRPISLENVVSHEEQDERRLRKIALLKHETGIGQTLGQLEPAFGVHQILEIVVDEL